jgi:hypothetical protein
MVYDVRSERLLARIEEPCGLPIGLISLPMEDAMALYDRPHDPAPTDPRHPRLTGRPSMGLGPGSALPLIVAAAVAIALLAMLYPNSGGRVGDANNAGPSVQTVTPSPSPTTSPAIPTPTPTTEPRPTQAPIR